MYRAIDRRGLDVNRSSVARYDEGASVSKRLGRQTATVLEQVLRGGRLALKKVMLGVKGQDLPAAPRVNESTVLLRVER